MTTIINNPEEVEVDVPDWFPAFEMVLGQPYEKYEDCGGRSETWLLGRDSCEIVVLRNRIDGYWVGCYFDHDDGSSLIFQGDVDELQINNGNVRAENSSREIFVSISPKGKIIHSGMYGNPTT